MATTKKATRATKKPVAKKPTTTKTTTTVKTVAAQPAKRFSFSSSNLLAAGIAEFIGTFLLAAIVLSLAVGGGAPLVVGFSLAAIVLIIGVVSGAHVNPAITIGAWVTRKIDAARALVYVIAQVLGASLAFVTLNYFASQGPKPDEAMAALGQTAAIQLPALPALPAGGEFAILLAEIIGTAILALGVATAIRSRERVVGALSVGLGIVVALYIASIAASFVYASQAGAVLNPAVAVAMQAFVAFDITKFATYWPLAVYIVGPAIGAIIGFFLYDLLRTDGDEK